MAFRPSMVNLDFAGVLPDNCRCLYSYWKGYLSKPDWVELIRDIERVGGDFIPAHTSGHIFISDLVEFVKTVNARTVIPIHTFEPIAFARHVKNAFLLEDGRSVQIKDLS